jgi:hypothetical protein
METAIVILLLVIGAVGGSLVTHAWMIDTGQPAYHDDTEHSVGDTQ